MPACRATRTSRAPPAESSAGARAASCELADARKELDIARGALREAKHALDMRSAEREGTRTQLAAARKDLCSTTANRDVLKTQFDTAHTDLTAARSDLAAAHTDLATRTQELAAMRADLEVRLRELDDAGAQLGETTRALEAAKDEAASLARQLGDALAGSVDAAAMAALKTEMELKTHELADAWGMLDVANSELDATRTEREPVHEQLDAQAADVKA